jgi:hypothetical protein
MALARLRHAARTLQYAEIDSLYGIACAGDGLALPTVNRPYYSMRRPSTDLAKKTPGFLDQCGRPSSRWACIGPILGSSVSICYRSADPQNVRILPAITGRLIRAHSPIPHSAKTYENPAGGASAEKRMSFR